jgi:hypothetical protein
MLIRPYQYIHTALLIYPYGPGANTANLESIPGPIQKQPVSNTMLLLMFLLLLLLLLLQSTL